MRRALHAVFLSMVILALGIFFPRVSAHGAEQFRPELFAGMRWRLIGPFRGGRALTASGVSGQPDVFYFGAVDGGVWKTTDAGRTWQPIFDAAGAASIGALAVAPSDPNIIYVGTGEADMRSDITYGNGVYKSTDAGRTWSHLGLEDTRQIGRILIDPKDPNRVFVAALGHAYGPNAQRGVFRSADGGRTWEKVLFKDDNTGAIDLAIDPSNSQVLYATLWQTRRPPWNVYPPSNGPGSGLYKSTDGGSTWHALSGHGLPSEGLGRMGVAVAPSNPRRVYLIVDAKEGGLYRSDDAGENWQRIGTDPRIWTRGWYFGGVTVDPQDENTVYIPNIALYRSQDGGKTFTVFKGAPGGDDYHFLWIEPNDPRRMIVASDQGTVISANGGETWSSWYNQPTAQLYHVTTDTRFPYWVYGAQQDSGSVAVPSRSPYRGINAFSWRPVRVGGESQYLAPDPVDPEILFGGGFYASVGRVNLQTEDYQSVPPTLAHPGEYRTTWTMPLVFSPLPPHRLYYGTQVLFETSDRGRTWHMISPDLTRANPGVPSNLDAATAADTSTDGRRGVIYTIAPSRQRADMIWIGTDDGLIQLTRDGGKTWTNVTPRALTPWSKVSMLEVSPFDAETAYAAVDRHRLDDLRPYFFRTHDGGKTWQEISQGIPEGSYVQVVREDPARRGLLYAGTETGVYVSFDDGDHWQSLQLNLPPASVRDLVIHGDDLVAGTHGRSIWILDDLAPLRELSAQVAASDAWLFRPATARRVRPGFDQGTPLPDDEPAGQNPPSGAIFDYFLKSSAPVTLEIYDAGGRQVRKFSSAEKPAPVNYSKLAIAPSWVHHEQPPSDAPGMHRFIWDLRYPGPPARFDVFSGGGSGPWAVPGRYTVKMTAAGKTFTQPLAITMDPRVKATQADLQQQFDLDMQVVAAREEVTAALRQAASLAKQLGELRAKASGEKELASAIENAERELTAVLSPEPASSQESSGEEPVAPNDLASLRYVSHALSLLETTLESADAAPSPDALRAWSLDQQLQRQNLATWQKIKAQDVPRLNALLSKAHLAAIRLSE